MIYLDNNATTPLDPAVRQEMIGCMELAPGNPSSLHEGGLAVRRVIDLARQRVARLIGASSEEIFFTSGGTEADNLAILGMGGRLGNGRGHIVTSAVEHQAVLNPCRHIGKAGGAVTFLPVDAAGRVDPAALACSLRDDTVLISVMAANNETGTLQPLRELRAAIGERQILLHTDAVSAVGKIPFDVKASGIDLLSFSAHKLHGPAGVGALYVRKGLNLDPLWFGGHQEKGLRPGTENVIAIAGFGKACELALPVAEEAARLTGLRDAFEVALAQRVSGVELHAARAPRVCNTSCVHFEGVDAEMLMLHLDLAGIAVSTQAACASGDREPSHVLLAMGVSPEAARSTLRFSFGRTNTSEELPAVIQVLEELVPMLRGGLS